MINKALSNPNQIENVEFLVGDALNLPFENNRFDNVVFRRGAFMVLGDELVVSDTINISERGRLTHYDARLDGFISHLEIKTKNLEIASDSSIDVDGRGYLGGKREGNGCAGQTEDGFSGSTESSGGSFGGKGAIYTGTPNDIYGSVTEPQGNGSGGSCRGAGHGGDGGGNVPPPAQHGR